MIGIGIIDTMFRFTWLSVTGGGYCFYPRTQVEPSLPLERARPSSGEQLTIYTGCYFDEWYQDWAHCVRTCRCYSATRARARVTHTREDDA